MPLIPSYHLHLFVIIICGRSVTTQKKRRSSSENSVSSPAGRSAFRTPCSWSHLNQLPPVRASRSYRCPAWTLAGDRYREPPFQYASTTWLSVAQTVTSHQTSSLHVRAAIMKRDGWDSSRVQQHFRHRYLIQAGPGGPALAFSCLELNRWRLLNWLNGTLGGDTSTGCIHRRYCWPPCITSKQP